jgi:hypothetical protein
MRELKLKTKHLHFKGLEYITLCVSKPIKFNDFIKSTMNLKPIICIHSEHKGAIKVNQFKNGNYYHLEEDCKDELVVYQALYRSFDIYVGPIDMFLSEVDKVKYPNISQMYRFEEIR